MIAASLRTARTERATMLLVAGVLLSSFGLGAAVQSAALYQLTVLGPFAAHVSAGTLLPRIIANGAHVVTCLVLMNVLALERRRGVWLMGAALLICFVASSLRAFLQIALDIYPRHAPEALVIDFIVAFVVTAFAIVMALVFVGSTRKLRTQELANAEQQVRASAALTALQTEELRVRREVAEGLHGTLQQRLVMFGVQLEDAANRLEALSTEAGVPNATVQEQARLLRRLAEETEVLREVDVRKMSQLLYPAGIELGLIQAARIMLRRLPESISARILVEDAARERLDGDEVPSELRVGRRILMLRIIEEALTNSLRHGHASTVRLRFGVDGQENTTVIFDDDGAGIGEQPPKLNGLGLLGERLAAFGGSLEMSASPLGGARVTAVLPKMTAVDQGAATTAGGSAAPVRADEPLPR